MAWVVEITGYNPATSSASAQVFAMGAGIAFTDTTYAPSGFISWKSANQRVNVAREGGVDLQGDSGQLVLQNLPNDIGSAGPLDALADWAWQNRRANLYWVPGTLWSAKVLVDTAIMQQPFATLVSSGDVQSTLNFQLRDARAGLDVPLQPTKYAGTNSGGSGVEGESDIKGKPKPVLYGVVSNIPGVRVNASQLIYQVADKSATILCVRDGGLGLSAGTARGSLASLQSNTPTPGTYDTYAGSEGTFVKLGTTPVFQITIDAQEGTPAANRSHAQIWSRFRQERCGNVSGDIVAASVTAADALDANEVGFWWADETTQLAALNEILTSFSGYEVQGFDLKWSFAKLVAPSGATTLDFIVLSRTSELTTKSRPLRSLTRVRPDFAPDGAPPYRVTVNWGRSYTIMNEADFAGGAPQRLRDKFSKQYRAETATNTAIWNPSTGAGPWPNAPELTVNTAYQPGADGLTCPHAQTEAARLLALYSANKAQFQLDFTPKTTDQVLAGAVVSITYPQLGLAAGPLFRVLQSSLTVESEVARMSLVVGLQT